MTLSILITGLVVAMTGKVLLGYTVIAVHSRVMREHSIDEQVIRTIRKERQIALWGIVLIIVGTGLEVLFYLSGPFV